MVACLAQSAYRDWRPAARCLPFLLAECRPVAHRQAVPALPPGRRGRDLLVGVICAAGEVVPVGARDTSGVGIGHLAEAHGVMHGGLGEAANDNFLDQCIVGVQVGPPLGVAG